ncbi:hypothetical protein SAMN04487944_11527 [Gracilibacillus ureilyticus]|uniref:Uncharacterized protein n=1 Tax=Gracilibacillus ureilyticus TaxID=531814 RepID=A0A1H9TWW9_9BACI|nr:hypothetical protein [Gracilibacillus ureilyticus]SES01531.1 hypothetical protein SAMN04487944_11527 [Gracilibacillus ureilyticus]
MEKNTETQILNELKMVNQKLNEMNWKLDDIDSESRTSLWNIFRSLLIGILLVGPCIAIAIGLLQIVYTWIFK